MLIYLTTLPALHFDQDPHLSQEFIQATSSEKLYPLVGINLFQLHAHIHRCVSCETNETQAPGSHTCTQPPRRVTGISYFQFCLPFLQRGPNLYKLLASTKPGSYSLLKATFLVGSFEPIIVMHKRLSFCTLNYLKVGVKEILSLNPLNTCLQTTGYLLSKCVLAKYNRLPLQESKLELRRLPMTIKENTQRLHETWYLRPQSLELSFLGLIPVYAIYQLCYFILIHLPKPPLPQQ